MFTIATDTDERDHATNSRRHTHTQYFKVSDVYRTPNVNYRHFKLLTIHEIGPSNSGKHSNQKNHTRN